MCPSLAKVMIDCSIWKNFGIKNKQLSSTKQDKTNNNNKNNNNNKGRPKSQPDVLVPFWLHLIFWCIYIFIYILDAFCRCVVTYHPQDTYIVWETRSPTWDTMLVFNDIELWGDVQEFVVNPPVILLEIFDKDPGVCHTRIIYWVVISCVESNFIRLLENVC